MEQVYNASAFQHASKKIHLKSYFSEFQDLGQLFMTTTSIVEALPLGKKISIARMGTDSESADLKDWFGKNEILAAEHNLTVEGEPPPVYVDSFDKEYASGTDARQSSLPKEATVHLKTLEALSKASKEERINVLTHTNDTWFECRPSAPTVLKPTFLHKEIVVTVRIYKSLKPLNGEKPVSASVRYTQEIELLGRNTLADLRDAFKCPEDYVDPNDQSETAFFKTLVHIDKNAIQKNLFKSGCLYIEGCFYVDSRSVDFIDYSEPILTWSKHPSVNVGPMKKAKMEDTKIEDLELRFGYPYVYIHQGHHEHLVTFTGARLSSYQDYQLAKNYPYERSVGHWHTKVCNVCEKRLVKWFTMNNERVPEDPFYFCDVCFKKFNYDKDGGKMCDFKAYSFVHQGSL